MRIIADLQIHSKYSRACSQDLIPKNIGLWADKKGIGVIGTGDFTHPKWLLELKAALEEVKPGLYSLRDTPPYSPPILGGRGGVRLCLCAQPRCRQFTSKAIKSGACTI